MDHTSLIVVAIGAMIGTMILRPWIMGFQAQSRANTQLRFQPGDVYDCKRALCRPWDASDEPGGDRP